MIHHVSTGGELSLALANCVSGDEIHLDASGGPYSLSVYYRDYGPDGITITSADPADPATFDNIDIGQSSGLTIDNVALTNTGNAGWFLLTAYDSSDLAFRNISADGGATAPGMTEAEFAPSFADMRNVTDVEISNCTVSGALHGLTLREGRNASIDGNEFAGLQGDGVRMGGIENVTVSGNYFHDFLGTDYDLNHPDAIQVWSTGTTINNNNLTIDGNIIDAGEGVATQSIFIRNDKYEGSGDAAHLFRDFTITNNTIHNGHWHGITIADTAGVEIARNVLVEDTDATIVRSNGSGEHGRPEIRLGAGLSDLDVAGNVATFADSSYSIAPDNLALSYTNVASPAYVGAQFADPWLAEEARFALTPVPGSAAAALQAGAGFSGNRFWAGNAPALAAADDTATVEQGATAILDLLANDTGGAGAAITQLSAAAHGQVEVTANGHVQYTATAGFAGTDTFRYFMEDGSGGADIATVTISVGSAPPFVPPVLVSDAVTIIAGRSASVSPLLNDAPGSGPVTLISVAAAAQAAIAINADQSLTVTPDAGASGQEVITYSVEDAQGTLHTGQLTLTFAEDPAAPEVPADDVQSLGHTQTSFNLDTGADVVVGQDLDNHIRVSGGDDRVFGGGGDDRLRGGSGDDHLCGQEGNDTLFGGAGDDVLWGGAGRDVLVGDRGNAAKRGADRFVFTESDIGEVDIVRDFAMGEGDMIDLAALSLVAAADSLDNIRLEQAGTDVLLSARLESRNGEFVDIVRLKDLWVGFDSDAFETGHLLLAGA